MSFRSLRRALVIAALVFGCGRPQLTPLVIPGTDRALPDTPRNLPTHLDFGATPAATLVTSLVQDGDCLIARAAGNAPVLPVWPSTYWLDDSRLMDGHKLVTELGVEVTLVGGTYDAERIAQDLTNPIPDRCRSLVAGYFWVGGVDISNSGSNPL